MTTQHTPVTEGPRKATVGAKGQVVWFAYISATEMLRSKNGVGRRFKSEASARAAIAKAKGE